MHSFMSILATQALLLGTRRTRPSLSSRRNASRTGMRLVPNLSASPSWRMRLPGASSPVRIRCRMFSVTRWLASVRSAASGFSSFACDMAGILCGTHHFFDGCRHFLAAGERGSLENLRDRRRCFAARESFDRTLQQVEMAALDFVREPGTVGSSPRPLLDDQDTLCFADACVDGDPVETRAIEPAQIDDIGIGPEP